MTPPVVLHWNDTPRVHVWHPVDPGSRPGGVTTLSLRYTNTHTHTHTHTHKHTHTNTHTRTHRFALEFRHVTLTADEHDADGEDLLGVGVGRDVPEAHAGEAAEGEVERRHVLVLDGRARAGVAVGVALADGHAQVVQPA